MLIPALLALLSAPANASEAGDAASGIGPLFVLVYEGNQDASGTDNIRDAFARRFDRGSPLRWESVESLGITSTRLTGCTEHRLGCWFRLIASAAGREKTHLLLLSVDRLGERTKLGAMLLSGAPEGADDGALAARLVSSGTLVEGSVEGDGDAARWVEDLIEKQLRAELEALGLWKPRPPPIAPQRLEPAPTNNPPVGAWAGGGLLVSGGVLVGLALALQPNVVRVACLDPMCEARSGARLATFCDIGSGESCSIIERTRVGALGASLLVSGGLILGAALFGEEQDPVPTWLAIASGVAAGVLSYSVLASIE